MSTDNFYSLGKTRLPGKYKMYSPQTICIYLGLGRGKSTFSKTFPNFRNSVQKPRDKKVNIIKSDLGGDDHINLQLGGEFGGNCH